MFCEYCGKEISNDSRFCPHCGASIGNNERVINDSDDNTYTADVKMQEQLKEEYLKKEKIEVFMVLAVTAVIIISLL